MYSFCINNKSKSIKIDTVVKYPTNRKCAEPDSLKSAKRRVFFNNYYFKVRFGHIDVCVSFYLLTAGALGCAASC